MATKAKTYFDKLKHPEWQKLRLKVLERDNFQCTRCPRTEETLHVHHLYYDFGKEPWEYDLDAFTTLCIECHESEEFFKKMYKNTLRMLQVKGVSYMTLENLISIGFTEDDYEDFLVSERLRFAARSPHIMNFIQDEWLKWFEETTKK